MKKKIDKTYNWLIFSQSYLYLSRLGCQEILEQKYSKYKFLINVPIKYRAPDLFIPIFYNIKHGIESFIKTIKIILTDKLDKKDFKHNISELFETVKSEITKNRAKIEKVIKEKRKQDSENVNLELAEKDLSDLSALINNLEELVYKYYYCDVLKNKIGSNFFVEDINNTTFRFPDNNLQIKIDYGNMLSNIDNKDIEEILDDIEKLADNFNRLGFLLNIYRRYAKNKITT